MASSGLRPHRCRAFVALIWLAWVRFTVSAPTQDEFEAKLKEQEDRIASLKQQVTSLKQQLEAAMARQRRQALPPQEAYQAAQSASAA